MCWAGSGYLRVTVSPAAVTVDYVRSYLPADENAKRSSGQVSYSYTVAGAVGMWITNARRRTKIAKHEVREAGRVNFAAFALRALRWPSRLRDPNP